MRAFAFSFLALIALSSTSLCSAATAQRPVRAQKVEDQQAAKPGCVMGWLAELQKKAEEVRREADRKGRKP